MLYFDLGETEILFPNKVTVNDQLFRSRFKSISIILNDDLYHAWFLRIETFKYFAIDAFFERRNVLLTRRLLIKKEIFLNRKLF